MEPILFPRPHETRVRAPRLALATTVVVKASTIGTATHYPLIIENLSRSGMLLSWDSGVRIPFIENTIVDMVIDVESALLTKPLKCLGKIVRRTNVDAHGRSATFGVRIVQMEAGDLERWEAVLIEQERMAAAEAPAEEPAAPALSLAS